LKEDKETNCTWILTIPANKFNRILNDYPDLYALLRQRAILRRAFWRKIELEYEVSLAKELGLQLDPWHHVPYNEWKV
jgi:hypothetical protein